MAKSITTSVYIKWDQDIRIPHEIWTTGLGNFSVSIGLISGRSRSCSLHHFIYINCGFSHPPIQSTSGSPILEIMQLQHAQGNDYSSISTPLTYLHDMIIKDNNITHKSILYSYFDKYIILFWKVISKLTRLYIYPFFSCFKTCNACKILVFSNSTEQNTSSL
jgi:hypothetical protein